MEHIVIGLGKRNPHQIHLHACIQTRGETSNHLLMKYQLRAVLSCCPSIIFWRNGDLQYTLRKHNHGYRASFSCLWHWLYSSLSSYGLQYHQQVFHIHWWNWRFSRSFIQVYKQVFRIRKCVGCNKIEGSKPIPTLYKAKEGGLREGGQKFARY